MDWNARKILKYKYLAVVLIIVLAFIFDFYPRMKRAVELKEDIKKAQAPAKRHLGFKAEQISKTAEQELFQIEKNLGFIKDVVEEIKDQVIGDKNIPLVTIELEDLAESLEIELTSVRPLESQVDNDYEILPVEIGFQTEYQRLIQFLSQVEDSSTVMTIRNLSIKRNEKKYPQLDISVVLCVLFEAGGD